MHLLIVPPLTQASRIPELLDTARYRVTHVAVVPTTSEHAAFVDEFISGQQRPYQDQDGDNALTRHYLYIFYEAAIPKTTAQLIAEKDAQLEKLESAAEGRAKAYRETHGGIC